MIQDNSGTFEWGVKHSQGIYWCRSERNAREEMAMMVRADARRQHQARGQVRLLRRWVSAVVEVENPYESDPS